MVYPKRIDAHIFESDSMKIVGNYLPREWIIRNVTERDYGIDLYLEIVEKNGDVTGKLCSIQVKSSKKIEYLSKQEITRKYDINLATTNYWYNLPVPVILIYVDLENKDALYLPVKEYIRKNFGDYNFSQKLNYDFKKNNNLKEENEADKIYRYYEKEIHRHQFELLIIDFITNYDNYLEIIDYHACRDPHYELEHEENMRITNYYNKLKFLSNYLDIEWDITLEKLQDEAFNFFQIKKLHELQASKLVQSSIKVIDSIINNIFDDMFTNENEYWENQYNNMEFQSLDKKSFIEKLSIFSNGE